MGILRSDRVSGLGGANAINGSVDFTIGRNNPACLIVPSDDFALGTGDFTLECWYYRSGLGTHDDAVGNIIMMTGNTPNDQNGIWLADAQGKLEGRVHYGSGSWNLDITSSTTMSANTWYHVAMSRSGSAVKIFIDGALEASGTSSSDLTTAYSNEAYIGGQGNSFGNRGINGYVSNARISNTALYTAAFTVPSARLEKLSSTLLLCCQSPGNALQEATGKKLMRHKHVAVNAGPVASRKSPDIGEDHGTTFADNTKFDTLSYMVPPGGTTAERGRGRGILFGGGSPGRTDRIDYIEIPSGGNSIDFGNLVCGSVWGSGAGASSTRGVFWGGENQYTKLDYVTIATTGNATSFGTSSNQSNGGTCMSSETRAVFVLGAQQNIMEYVTIASTGNTTDFGDQGIDDSLSSAAGLASPTRGIVSGGYGPSPYPQSNTIEYITIATTGNGTDFGDLTFGHSAHTGVSNTTRGVFAKGYTFPSPATVYYNTIEYVTIASTGNATDFGDATNTVSQGYGSSTHIRGVFAGGNGGSDVNTIDYITIASTGDAIDFGDTHSPTRSGSGTSDSHGGIS